ncbi:MAG: sterol desaturase family protein [Erythrobacter sp.]
MDAIWTALIALLDSIWIPAIVFFALAAVTKRKTIFAAIVRTRKEFSTNLGLAIINAALISPLIAFPKEVFHEAVYTPAGLVVFWQDLPPIIMLLVAILCLDFVTYWRHRIEHHPLLWRIHATHHADEQIHWFTLFRKHPLSAILASFADIVLLLFLGFPPGAVVIASLLRSWWGLIVHADVKWTFGPVGEFLISPAAHRLHHIRDEQLMGSNFGNTFTFWDKMFGTYVDPKPYLNCEVGIAEGSRGLLGELWRPFERRYWRLRKPQSVASESAAPEQR